MARIGLRPTPAELELIARTLKRSNNITTLSRRDLLMVEAWGEGKTFAEVAALPEFACSSETVRRAVHRYKLGGLPFFLDRKDRRPGRPITLEGKAAEIAAILARSFALGDPVSYRAIRREKGVSLGFIASVAEKFKLNGDGRRGPVAPA